MNNSLKLKDILEVIPLNTYVIVVSNMPNDMKVNLKGPVEMFKTMSHLNILDWKVLSLVPSRMCEMIIYLEPAGIIIGVDLAKGKDFSNINRKDVKE